MRSEKQRRGSASPASHPDLYAPQPQTSTENIMPQTLTDTITALAKRRGLYWPSYEIYGGQSGYITYGDLGTKLKRNITAHWRRHFTDFAVILARFNLDPQLQIFRILEQ